MRNKFVTYSKFNLQLQYETVCAFDCTIIRLICLTAKALRKMAMRGFLVGTTEPDNHTLNMPFFVNDSRYKRVQLRLLGL
jgi:hypothetical protein